LASWWDRQSFKKWPCPPCKRAW